MAWWAQGRGDKAAAAYRGALAVDPLCIVAVEALQKLGS